MHPLQTHRLRGSLSRGLLLRRPNFLVIHPDECIDCALCEPECPVAAIRAEDEVPLGQRQFIALNGELAAHPNWTQITRKKPAPDDHDAWFGLPGKLAELDRNGA